MLITGRVWGKKMQIVGFVPVKGYEKLDTVIKAVCINEQGEFELENIKYFADLKIK